jgi:low temperature requirement protein LtrA
VGYAWLTSVVDPEEGWARLLVFCAIGGLLVAALALPHSFVDDGLTFALAYAVVRSCHIALFTLASRDDPTLRRSVIGHAASTFLCFGLLVVGALGSTRFQTAVWALALVLDLAEPYFFGVDGWELVPGHFAERHGLIVLVALGESIVALGVGADAGLGAGELVAAVLGVAFAAALWWAYFDHVSISAVARLEEAPVGAVQNALARDGYSYLHFPLVAGIVLSAFGIHESLTAVHHHLHDVAAVGLAGGAALHLLGHVAFRWRAFHSLKVGRLVAAAACLALVPVGLHVEAIGELALVTAVLWVLVAYETIRYAEQRAALRHGHGAHAEA